jgi:Zn-dependent protease with chaperone function
LPYAVFFGIYGIVKFYIEKIGKTIPEYLLKLVFFNVIMAASIFFIKNFISVMITTKLALWAIIPIAEAVFLLYDYVYTRIIAYYINRVRRMLKF